MDGEHSARSGYYRAIARAFLARRGAPFYLSPQDLSLIADWERLRIPLPVVLEGIEKAFEPGRGSVRKKIQALRGCAPMVKKSLDLHRERRVGKRRVKKGGPAEDPRLRVHAEVVRFLDPLPPAVPYLEGIYRRAQELLANRETGDALFEELDERVDELLLRHCGHDEKIALREAAIRDYPGRPPDEVLRIFHLRLIKHLREKYKIPYFSFYYY
ncbi:MAG: hypothetical protein JW742_06210 [Candidatus Aminicenantes bacterium]|nr:hypothetical protein [Candidatus Aminicenantes bacterium]